MPPTWDYAFKGAISGCRRPLCVRALGAGVEMTHGRGRTAPGGRVFMPPIRAFPAFDLRRS